MNRCGRFLLILASSGLTTLAIGCGGGDVPAPTSFVAYNANNGDFSLVYPKGWEASGRGKKNHVLEVTKGPVTITVRSDLTGSLMGDIAGSMGHIPGGIPDTQLAGEGGEASEELDLEPVAQVHRLGKKELAEAIKEYSEGEAEKVQTGGLGEGRMSEFTGKRGLRSEIRGCRGTALSRDKRVVVICTCPASNWKALQPAFKKVVESLDYGEAKL